MVYPLETNITWVSGFDSMTSYTFGKERIAHTFCSTCGTSVGGKSTDPNFFADNRAVNVSLPHLSTSFPGICPSTTLLGRLCSRSAPLMYPYDVLVIQFSLYLECIGVDSLHFGRGCTVPFTLVHRQPQILQGQEADNITFFKTDRSALSKASTSRHSN